MFRGGFSGGKTREEFVEEVADVYIGKVSLTTNTTSTVISSQGCKVTEAMHRPSGLEAKSCDLSMITVDHE